MIEWVSVGFGAAWILGLGLILATASLANYLSHRDTRCLRDVLGEGGFQVAVNLGMALFCAGWSDSAEAAWERVLWGILAVSFLIQAWLAERARRERGNAERQP
jgi:hypothetical protein